MLRGKIDDIETQLNSLNMARNPGEIQRAEKNIWDTMLYIGEAIMGVLCARELLKGGAQTPDTPTVSGGPGGGTSNLGIYVVNGLAILARYPEISQGLETENSE